MGLFASHLNHKPGQSCAQIFAALQKVNLPTSERNQLRYSIQSLNLLNAYSTIDERLPRLANYISDNPPTVFAGQEILIDPKFSEAIHLPTAAVFAEAGLTIAVTGNVRNGHVSVNAIWYQASKLDLVSAGEVHFPETPGLRLQAPHAIYSVFRTSTGAEMILFDVHLSWGAEKSSVRYSNLRLITNRAAELQQEHPTAVIFIAGDFNAIPTNDEIRFLRGETLHEPGEFWVDAWEWLHPDEPGFTQHPTSWYAVQTALGVGIADSSNLPKRRIDFLMIRGWAYGRLGPRPKMSLWGGPDVNPVSDHLGINLSFGI